MTGSVLRSVEVHIIMMGWRLTASVLLAVASSGPIVGADVISFNWPDHIWSQSHLISQSVHKHFPPVKRQLGETRPLSEI